jgi:hypothetical protein
MPFDIRPLRTLAIEITRRADRGASDGSLDVAEVNELNRCAGALTRIAELATTYHLGDVLGCDCLYDLMLLRDKYTKQYLDLAKAIDRVVDRPTSPRLTPPQ